MHNFRKIYKNKSSKIFAIIASAVIAMSAFTVGTASAADLDAASDTAAVETADPSSNETVAETESATEAETNAGADNLLSSLNSTGVNVSASSNNSAAVPEYKTWKQFGESWSNMYIGRKTCASIGCAVVSLAMLCVHSGAVNDENFNPGVLITALKSKGAFSSSGDITWSKITEYTSALKIEQNKNLRYSSQKAALSAVRGFLASGYYPIIRVNNNGSTHFVCVDYVSNDEIYIMDPGKSNATQLFKVYGYKNITGVRLFKSANGNPASLVQDGTMIPADDSQEEGKVSASVADAILDFSGNVVSAESSGYLAGKYTTIATLNLRSDLEISDDNVIATIPKGTALTVEVTTADGWGKASYNGKTGWVCMRYVKQS